MKTFLRIESALVLAAAIGFNAMFGGNWWLFGLFAVLPELALLCYLYRDRTAWWPSLIYNLLHTYALPLVLGVALLYHRPTFLLGWVANIAFLRTIGLGFKSRPSTKTVIREDARTQSSASSTET